MKKYLDGILIVEGNNDASFISSFIETEIVSLNGLELKDIDYLIYASNFKKIYLLTDPDETGILIRNKINKLLNVINVEIDINKCNKKNNKKGVAECEIREILNKLGKYLINDKPKKYEEISLIDIINIPNKEYIKKKYHLGNCNNKKMIERLNSLKVKREELHGN